jgi:hypothetical protein
MKHYLLALYQPQRGGERPPPEVLDKVMQDVRAIREEMKASGAWVFSGGLDAPDKTSVLKADGHDVFTTDGPFVASKEHIAGMTIVRVPDREAALAWARKLIKVTGMPIEVRPFLEHSND